MLIEITDYNNKCFNVKDGLIIFNIIKPLLDNNKDITISFKNIDTITPAFINTAFIQLLNYFNIEYIKSHIKFINSNKYINDLIKKRFNFESKQIDVIDYICGLMEGNNCYV